MDLWPLCVFRIYLGIDLVWHFVDMVITFMTIPNLIAIILLSSIVKQEADKYFKDMKTIL